MITLHCDNCEKAFEIDDDAAGEKATCPYCGDVNRVPTAARKTGGVPAVIGRAPDRAADAQAETQITTVRAAMFRAHPFWYILMVLLFLGGIALAFWASMAAGVSGLAVGDPNASRPHELAALAGLGLIAVAVLWWLIWWAAPHRWVKLIITNKRTIRQEGIIVRKTSEVLHNHIRNVKIEQSFLNRILGVGSLSIDSAGGSDDEPIEIQMDHVPQPYQVKEIFDRYRRM